MSKKHYLIYQITNTVNNKIYIGKHITKNVDDDYFGSGKYLKHAQKKYGLDKFVKTILFELQNKEEMDLLEKYVVTKEFCDRDDVYNIKIGGDGGWDYVNDDLHLNGNQMFVKNMSKEDFHIRAKKAAETFEKRKATFTQEQREEYLKKKQQVAAKGFIGCFLGRKHKIESRQKMKETNAKFHPHSGKHNFMYGKMWICNDETSENRIISKTDLIPAGWRKGRISKNRSSTQVSHTSADC